MNPNQRKFQQTAVSILGHALNWQTNIAEKLNVPSDTVAGWMRQTSPTPIPEKIWDLMIELVASSNLEAGAVWPRDEWTLGDSVGTDGKLRTYLVHLQSPRFIARVVDTKDDDSPLDSEQPVDDISGVVFVQRGRLLCEINWLDPVPSKDIAGWLEAGLDAIQDIDTALNSER